MKLDREVQKEIMKMRMGQLGITSSKAVPSYEIPKKIQYFQGRKITLKKKTPEYRPDSLVHKVQYQEHYPDFGRDLSQEEIEAQQKALHESCEIVVPGSEKEELLTKVLRETQQITLSEIDELKTRLDELSNHPDISLGYFLLEGLIGNSPVCCINAKAYENEPNFIRHLSNFCKSMSLINRTQELYPNEFCEPAESKKKEVYKPISSREEVYKIINHFNGHDISFCIEAIGELSREPLVKVIYHIGHDRRPKLESPKKSLLIGV